MDKVISLFQGNDYRSVFPGIEPMAQTDLFVRVSCYDIIVPVKKMEPRPVNVFEEAALRFLALNRGYTAKDVAERLCVEEAFVKLLFMCLEQLGFIDNRRQVTARGREILEDAQTARETDHADAMLNAHVFVTKNTRRCLSYVHVGELTGERVVSGDKEFMTVAFGNAGSEVKRKGRILQENDRGVPQLRRDEIRRLLTKYNSLCKKRARPLIPFVDGYCIDCAQGSDVLLHCKAIIQKGYADAVLVSDGFTAGSDSLTEYVSKFPFIGKQIREKAEKGALNAQAVSEQSPEKRDLYWPVEKLLRGQPLVDGDHDENREAMRRARKNIQDLFTATEWAFHYCVQAEGVSAGMQKLLLSQTTEQNRDMLLLMAKNLGIRFEGHSQLLLSNLNRKQLGTYFNGEQKSAVACYTVLPLAIVSAREGGGGAARLGEHMPDFPQWLWRLNLLGGKFRHETDADPVSQDEYTELKQKVYDLIRLLLPELSLSEQAQTQARSLPGASQRRLNAGVALSRVLGWELYDRINEGIKEELMQISPDKSPAELPPAREYVLTLSRILENVLAASSVRKPWKSQRQVLDSISETHGITLPDWASGMHRRYFEAAMNGRKTTLNGRLLSYLYGADKNSAEPALKAGLVSTVEWVGQLRGHGSDLGIIVDVKELQALRQSVFDIVKAVI